MKILELKTIDIQTKEWFDKVNGNTYFASLITLNYGLNDEVVLKNGFQYGYGSQSETEAFKTVKNFLNIENMSLNQYCQENNIVVRINKKSALKRDLKNI